MWVLFWEWWSVRTVHGQRSDPTACVLGTKSGDTVADGSEEGETSSRHLAVRRSIPSLRPPRDSFHLMHSER